MADLQQQSAALKPDQILEIIIRRRWLILIPLCLFLTLGLVYTLTAPKTYQASTTILIQPQKVPTDYVQSIVTTDIGQRIDSISQQILSRTNLEKIIKQYGLFQDTPGMYQEDRVNSVRKRVQVTQQSTRRQGTEAFSVSFSGSNPVTVMKVANELAGFFMDENLKARELQAMGTSEFLESELEKIKNKLEDREKTLSEYRAIHMGGLPDELETNLRTLDRLQLQHTDALNALRDTQNSANLLKNQISRLKEMSESGAATLQLDGTYVGTPALSTTEQQYELEKRQLDELLLKYTTKHPEVIKLTKSIANLAEKIEKEKEEKHIAKSGTSPDPDNTPAASAGDNVLFQHELSLKQMETEIVNIKASIQKIKQSMLVYQKRVEDTPKREQELQSIQRDYINIRESYSSLLARRLEAELAVNMEKKQKGEQFRILDHARLPEKPTSPDVRMLFMLSLAIGLGIGGGIIFLLEFINPVIRSEEQIEAEIGLPILASIPPLAQPGDRWKKWVEGAAFVIVSSYAGTILLFFALLNLKGIDKTLSLFKTYSNL
jgi:polysaccharide chain length determinant protein (PEP-CTERM system associated)